MDISVVIVSYNTCNLLRECLCSITERAIDLEVETIVVDNASCDGSQEMCRCEFPAVRLIENFENKRYAIANNQGWRVARGRNILFLNSDAVILNGALEAMSGLLDANDKAGACGCRLLNEDGTLQPSVRRHPTIMDHICIDTFLSSLTFFKKKRTLYKRQDFDYDREAAVDNISGAAVMVKRHVLEEIEGFDEKYLFYYEDTDLCRRIRISGREIWYTPAGRIIHYGGGSSEVQDLKPQLKYYFCYGTERYIKKYYPAGKAVLFCVIWKPLVILRHLYRIVWNGLRYAVLVVVGKGKKRLAQKSIARAKTSCVFICRYSLRFLVNSSGAPKSGSGAC